MNEGDTQEFDSWENGPPLQYSWATPIDINTFQSAAQTTSGVHKTCSRPSGRGKQILKVKEEDYYFNNGRKLTSELREVLGHGMSNYEIERHWGQFDDAESKDTESDICDDLSSLSMATCSSSFSLPSSTDQSSVQTDRKPLTFNDLDKPLEDNPLQKFKLALEQFARSNSKIEPPVESEEPKVRNVVVASLQQKQEGKKTKKKFRPLDLDKKESDKPSRPSLPRPVFSIGFNQNLPEFDNQNFPPL